MAGFKRGQHLDVKILGGSAYPKSASKYRSWCSSGCVRDRRR